MPDWLFHWTHDQVFIDILKAFIAALGPIAAGVITWFGIRWTGNLTKQTLENTKEATPPELLRLEKWSTILKDSEGYPKNISVDIGAIYSTYKDVLNRATLENRIKNMAIWDSEVEDKLLKIKPNSGQSEYPKEEWGVQSVYKRSSRILNWTLVPLILLDIVFLTYIIFNSGKTLESLFKIIFSLDFIINAVFLLGAVIIINIYDKYKRKLPDALMKNIVYRNCYYALREVFLVDGLELVESPDERKEREEFEKTGKYKKWQKENPQLTSWNYGLSIDRDNNPEKDKTDESAPETPNDLTGSESTPKDPKRQEP